MATIPSDNSVAVVVQPGSKAPSNLKMRVLTILIVAPIALLLVIAGGWIFALAITALAAVGAAEFYLLADKRPDQGSTVFGVPAVILVALSFQVGLAQWSPVILLIAFAATFLWKTFTHHDTRRASQQALMTGFGILYLGFPTGFLIAIRNLEDGLLWIMVILVLTWGTDTLAYVGGRLFGRHKLAPIISPKKTVEGAVIGYFGGFVSALILLIATNKLSGGALVLIAVGPIVAILGDLMESWLKREFGAKDSHMRGLNIFPGHGGVLDRVDALIMVTVLTFLCIVAFRLA
jgi:phosphatidate cytidylyltransferase